MDLIVIAGFLGSGKTSILLQLARPLAAAGRRIAVIENEIGKVGIDDQLLTAEGLRVKELYSGCICCSLRIDLVQTLLELERTWNPDLVLVEPSGVAGPDQVLDALVGYGGNIENRQMLVVLDATRAALLQSGTLPPVARGVHAADLLLVNKSDAVTPDVPASLTIWAHSIKPGLPVLTVSAHTGQGLETIAARLSPPSRDKTVCTKRAKPRAAAGHTHHEPADAPAAFSWHGKLAWPQPVPASKIQTQLSELLQQLARQVAKGETALPGHIKAIFQNRPAGGYLLLSTTSAAHLPQPRGSLPKMVQQGELTCNAILYGITTKRLATVFRQLLKSSGLPLPKERCRQTRAKRTNRLPRGARHGSRLSGRFDSFGGAIIPVGVVAP